MKRVAFWTAAAVAWTASAVGTQAASTSALAVPTPIVTLAPSARSRAMVLLQQAQRGVFDRRQFTEVMNAVVTPEVATQIGGQLRPLGTPTAMRFLYTEKRGISTLYAYRLTWPSASLDELVAIDVDQRISSLLFRSPQDASPSPTPSASAPG